MRWHGFAPAILMIVLTGAATGCDDDDIGGCEIETIGIGVGQQRVAEPSDAVPIHIFSIDHVGVDTYRQATFDLIAVIDSLGIQLCNCSELTQVSGACWPEFSIRLGLDATTPERAEIRAALLEIPVAGRLPVTEPPRDYGTFWIEAGSLSHTEWVLWYED